eukprot:CAMPEP_0174733288 /NCGR_PEP_ID=MMETSP1094-20130205/60999_1 /TAXON_ID=156173 /ORGANISM="Chrysochromulina brevifilum, Strain UTEX LB 985" /LENGTH=97 /DNA_ID=CAMNT_0015935925 /DNA_START=522 /DNA_END=815 /DNA_ORIENTATION=+
MATTNAAGGQLRLALEGVGKLTAQFLNPEAELIPAQAAVSVAVLVEAMEGFSVALQCRVPKILRHELLVVLQARTPLLWRNFPVTIEVKLSIQLFQL